MPRFEPLAYLKGEPELTWLKTSIYFQWIHSHPQLIVNVYKFKCREMTKPLLAVIETLKCLCVSKMHLTSPYEKFF